MHIDRLGRLRIDGLPRLRIDGLRWLHIDGLRRGIDGLYREHSFVNLGTGLEPERAPCLVTGLFTL